MLDRQIEMSFGPFNRMGSSRQPRQTRAQRWFQRMRQIVDRATDWQPTPPARPVQIWFPTAESRFGGLGGSQATPVPIERTDERQICE